MQVSLWPTVICEINGVEQNRNNRRLKSFLKSMATWYSHVIYEAEKRKYTKRKIHSTHAVSCNELDGYYYF